MAINFGQGVDLVESLNILGLFTVLSLAPAILILCKCFTRIIVVLAFIRQAIVTQNMHQNQLLVGFALFLTLFVMKPAGTAMYNNALVPYMNKKISSPAALKVIETELRGFMTKQVRKNDLQLL